MPLSPRSKPSRWVWPRFCGSRQYCSQFGYLCQKGSWRLPSSFTLVWAMPGHQATLLSITKNGREQENCENLLFGTRDDRHSWHCGNKKVSPCRSAPIFFTMNSVLAHTRKENHSLSLRTAKLLFFWRAAFVLAVPVTYSASRRGTEEGMHFWFWPSPCSWGLL